jgi:Phage terminase, small subunit
MGEQTAGERLRARVQSDLDAEGLELTGIEQELVDRACDTADRIAELEAVVEEYGPTTKGHRGLIVSPALTEIRHQAALLKSLLVGLAIEPQEGADAKTKKGRAAAAVRWDGRGGNRAAS